MKKIARHLKRIFHEESAQGATEYILLLVIVVGMAIAFGPRLKAMVTEKMESLSGQVGGFTGE